MRQLSTLVNRRLHLARGWLDARLSSFDFFISYAHRDARDFALALERALVRLNYRAFLDRDAMPPGQPLADATRLGLARSRVLLVVVTPGAVESTAVCGEVAIFKSLGRPIVPIDLDGILKSTRSDAPLILLLGDAIWISELSGPHPTGPSSELLDELQRSFKFIQQSAIRQRTLTVAAIVFAALAVLATAFALMQYYARQEADRQARVALSTGLASAAEARVGDKLDTALLLAAAAYDHAPTWQARSSLLLALEASPHLQEFLGTTGPSRYCAFTPDGRLGVSAATDGRLYLWDLNMRHMISTISLVPPQAVQALTISTDGRLIAVADADGVIHVWDTRYVHLGSTEFQGGSYIWALAFSPDGRQLAIGGSDDTILILDTETMQIAGPPLIAPEGMITHLAFGKLGAVLAAASARHVYLWDVARRITLDSPTAIKDQEVSAIAVSPGDDMVAVGFYDNSIALWDINEGRIVEPPLAGHPRAEREKTLIVRGDTPGEWQRHTQRWPRYGVRSLTFSADGRRLASGSEDRTVLLWDLATQKVLGAPLSGQDGGIQSIAFRGDGSEIVSASDQGQVVAWSPSTHNLIARSLNHGGQVMHIAVSGDGRTVASGSEDAIKLWDLPSGRQYHYPLTVPIDGLSSLVLNRRGTHLFMADEAAMIIDWHLGRGRAKPHLFHQGPGGHRKFIWSLALSDDGSLLVSGGEDRKIILWDTSTGLPRGDPLMGHGETIRALALSPDGRALASGDEGGSVFLWDLSSPRRPATRFPANRHSRIGAMKFSPDSSLLASTHLEKDVTIWDATSAQSLGPALNDHSDSVRSVAISADGHTLASASEDQTIILYDLPSMQALGRPLTGHFAPVWSVAFSPAAPTLASGGWDGTVILWNVDALSWRDLACRIANRNLTCAECIRYFAKAPCDAVCPGLPSGCTHGPESE